MEFTDAVRSEISSLPWAETRVPRSAMVIASVVSRSLRRGEKSRPVTNQPATATARSTTAPVRAYVVVDRLTSSIRSSMAMACTIVASPAGTAA